MPCLFIDADACPVKQETYRVAARHGWAVTVVGNAPLRIPDSPLVRLVVVGGGFDAADDWIAQQVAHGDIVITGDVPLAARCVAQGAVVVSPYGHRFDERNIGAAIATRNLLTELRESGATTGGPPPFDSRARSRFLQNLEQAIRQACRGEPPAQSMGRKP